MRDRLPVSPRRDVAVWALIDEIPAHPSDHARSGLGSTRPVNSHDQPCDGSTRAIRSAETGQPGARNRAWDLPDLIHLTNAAESAELIMP